jgi:6,7-dimethyl-8-ribityllumazine synthase
MKINIICTSYHKPQIEKMLEIAKKTATEENLTVENIYWLPGVLEIPYGIRKIITDSGDQIGGFVILGVIEKGKTKHGKVIGQAVIKDLIKFQTGSNGIPVGIGIIGPGASPEQIEERLEMHAENAVLAVSHLMKNISEWE